MVSYRFTVLICVGLIFLSSLFIPSEVKSAEKPNVLFIAIDDLNDWVNCMGGRKNGTVHTPNLDRLAKMGTLFMNAHCSAPACNPSRTSLMFGVQPSRSGVYSNNQPFRRAPVLMNLVTLPQHLRANGYKAVGGGKIFHSLEWHDGETDGYNDELSWDSFFPSLKRQMPHRVMPPKVPISGNPALKRKVPGFFDWGAIAHKIEEMPDHKVVDWAISELNAEQDKPIFLACGIFRPHIPWYVPQKFLDLYPLDEIKPPYNAPDWRQKLPDAAKRSGQVRRNWHNWVVENDEWEKALQGYLASISFADYQVGRLLDAYEKSPWKKNTIIVLWTDHGFHLGDKTTWEKFTLWEDSTQVPMMMVAPDVNQPGSVCHQPASLLDIFPTLMDLTQISKPDQLDGMSLLPQLKDPNTKRSVPALCTFGKGNHSLRGERFHYIRYNNGDEELYDHFTDEGEWNNLANDPKFEEQKNRLAKFLPKTDADNAPGGGNNGATPRQKKPANK